MVSCTSKVDESPAADTELYQHFANRQGLAVAQVRGFRLNDTVKIDVVVIEADDSAAWHELKKQLDIRTDKGVTSWLGKIDHPEQRTTHGDTPLWRAIAVHDERTVALYHMKNENQFAALREYQMKQIEN